MKVVIGYDGSASAREAMEDLRFAGLPRTLEARVLSVADVWLPPAGDPAGVPVPAPVARARALARQAVEQARQLAEEGCALLRNHFPEWQCEAEARADSPAWGVIKLALEWKADLIVVGSHGKSLVGRLLLGSVSQKVVTEAPCSVRIGRPRPEPTRPTLRLLLAFDGSPDASLALDTIVQRTWPTGTEVHVVAVLEPRNLTDLAAEESPLHQWVRPDDTEARQAFQRMLETADQRLRQVGLAVSSALLEGDPKRCLIEEEQRIQADCVFVGARGLNFLERFLLGSVSAAVAARARCSVEIVRPHH